MYWANISSPPVKWYYPICNAAAIYIYYRVVQLCSQQPFGHLTPRNRSPKRAKIFQSKIRLGYNTATLATKFRTMSMTKWIYIAYKASQLWTRSSSMCAERPSLTVSSRSSTGCEFQTVRPPPEKARRPSVLRRYRGAIRWCRSADRRCRLVTSATGVQQLTR